MKKKILSGISALALLIVTAYGVNRSMKSDANLSDLAMNNVEALAQGEINPDNCPYSQSICIVGNGWIYLGKRIW
ncbi:NVEALA domain-containing protein [Proteiniphilum acetatigenes]|uniref:NVEALA domain-containing protein n=1 Tax=Proteiniphilum acetatigenes TaxID=294710 RepID=UPI0003711802|nr:NVEALA domain-containing protein [Proteiniphilum acetatigenes]